MTSDRWQQISQLLHEALMRQGPAREAFLAESCRGDEALRGELDSLLAQLPSAQAFLERPAIDLSARTVSDAGASSLVSRRLDANDVQALLVVDQANYEVVREQGRGGHGRILAARDLRLDREVAIKELLINDEGAVAGRFVR